MFKQCQQHLCRFSLSSLPRSPGASPFSLSLLLFLPSSLPLYRVFLSLSFQASLLLTLVSVSLIPIKNVPSVLSPVPSYSLSFSASLLGWCIYMCNYYYVVVIHATLRHVQTHLVRVGKMVVFEYNMYLVYPTG